MGDKAEVNVRYQIKTKGPNEVLTVWQAKPSTPSLFLGSLAHLLGRVSSPGEVFLYFSPRHPSLSVMERCVEDRLCEVSSPDKKITLIQPTSWDNFGEILVRLSARNLMGVDAFAPAAPGYVPKPRRFFAGGFYWFKRYLGELKWWCIFHLDEEHCLDMELWARRGVSDACEKLADRLRSETAA